MNPVTDLRSRHDRRHSDPPNLWLAVLAGSLIVHLLLLLSGRLFLFRISSQKPAGVAAPIELVDLSPKSSNTTRLTKPRVAKSSVAPSTAARLPNSDSSVPPPVPDQQSVVQQIIKPSPVPVTPARSTPKLAPTRPRVSPSLITPAPRSTSQSAPSPSDPITPSPQPPFQSAPAPDAPAAPVPSVEPTPVPTPSPIGSPLPEPGIGRVPGESTQGLDESKQTNAGLPSVENAAPRGGTGVKASLLNIQDGNGGTTIPDKLARPIESSRLFSTLNYPPEVELNLGQLIRLIVLVDQTGKRPKVTSVVEPSRSREYDKFVSDLIQEQWTFEPALQGGKPVESLLYISVQVNSLK